MKEIKSKVQPNPMECSIWVDLNEDPYGSVKKYWNGSVWVKPSSSDNSGLLKELDSLRSTIDKLYIELDNLKRRINELNNNNNNSKLFDKVTKLTQRVNNLEQLINE